MATLNQVSIIGNLTRDMELRFTHQGKAVGDIAIAVNRTYNNPRGEKCEETIFVDIVVWEKLAETCAKYLAKGKTIFVGGRLVMDVWEDKATGQKRSKLKVIGENIQFLSASETKTEMPEV